MDAFGKIIVWQLVELRKDEVERMYEEFGFRSQVKLLFMICVDLNRKMKVHKVFSDFAFDLHDSTYYIYFTGMIQLGFSLLVLGSFKVHKVNKDGSMEITSPKYYQSDQFIQQSPSTITVNENGKFFYVGFTDGQLKYFQY
jgi:hypothetical protein